MKATPLRVIIVLTFFVVLAAALNPLSGRAQAQEGGETQDSRKPLTTDAAGSQGAKRKLSRQQRGSADFSPNVTCTFTLNPTSQAFGPAGGSNSFTVTAGNTCSWSAMSNAGWITINSGAGIGNGTAVVCNSLLVQRGAPDALRGRVFTAIMSVNYAAYALGFVIAGPLTDRVGPRWIFGGVGAVLAVASLVAYTLARGAEDTAGRRIEAEAA